MISLTKDKFIFPGFLVGLTCTINGFYISMGMLNLRINDIAFYLLLIFWLLYNKPVRNFYSPAIKRGMAIIIFMFIYMVAIRMYFFHDYLPIYQDFLIKYIINKLIWFPIYIGFYMLYGGNKFIFGVLLGIGVCSLLNSLIVIYEYISIVNGIIPDYQFIKNIGIAVEDKKFLVFNQGLIRPTGLMIDPNYTGAYAGIGALFWDYCFQKNRKRKFLICEILSIIPMILLYSRTGIFPYIICFFFSCLLVIKSPHKYRLISKQTLIFFSVILFVLFSYVFSTDIDLIDNITRRASMKDGSSLARLDYINYYFSHINILQLIFGVGMAGNFLAPFFGSEEVLHPESSYIAILMEYGALFLFSFIVLVAYIFFKLLKKNYYYSMIFLYLNLIGISYNFLGDRLYYFLIICFFLYTYTETPIYSNNLNESGN